MRKIDIEELLTHAKIGDNRYIAKVPTEMKWKGPWNYRKKKFERRLNRFLKKNDSDRKFSVVRIELAQYWLVERIK